VTTAVARYSKDHVDRRWCGAGTLCNGGLKFAGAVVHGISLCNRVAVCLCRVAVRMSNCETSCTHDASESLINVKCSALLRVLLVAISCALLRALLVAISCDLLRVLLIAISCAI
jgi:hypothetical protein